MPDDPPSIDKAKERAQEQLLYELIDSGDGQAPTREPISLYSSTPRQLGQASLGLGVYFTSLLLFGSLTLLLGIVSLLPLANNLSADEFSSSYTVSIHNADPGMPSNVLRSCPREYDVASNILRGTLGSHCVELGDTSNPIFCPAVCHVRLDMCQLDKRPQPQDICASITPSKEECEDPCTCCQAVLDTSKVDKQLPVMHYWVNTLILVIFLAWLVALSAVQHLSAGEIDKSVISIGDYAVYARNISKGRSAEDVSKLYSFFRHYGEVVQAIWCPKIGRTMDRGRRLHNLIVLRDELKALGEEKEKDAVILGGLCSWTYEKYVLFGTSRADKLEKVEKEISRLQEGIREATTAAPMSSGDGIIVYNYERHADNCYFDHQRSWWRVAWSYLGCGPGAPKFFGRTIFVQRAPEPSDVYWDNMDVRGWESVKRKILIIVGAAIQFVLEAKRDSERSAQLESTLAAELGGGGAAPAGGDDESLLESAYQTAKLRGLTATAGILVVILNMAITWSVNLFSRYERWHSKTDAQKYLMIKLAAAHFVNSAVVPVIAARNHETWYVAGGLVEQAFWIQVSNAWLPDILNVFNPLEIISKYAWAPHVRTQATLDAIFAPAEFDLAVRYAAVVKTLGLAMVFGPALPISYWIATAGIISTYWVDKWSAIRRTRAPAKLNPDVVNTINWALRVMGLVQLFMANRVFFHAASDAEGALFVGLVLWVAAAALPVGWLVRRCIYGSGSTKTTELGRGGTDDVPFTEAYNKRLEENRQALARAESIRVSGWDVQTRSMELYLPDIPTSCDRDWRKQIQAMFCIPPEVTPAVEQLLENQDARTGLEATRPPRRISHTGQASGHGGSPAPSPAPQPASGIGSGGTAVYGGGFLSGGGGATTNYPHAPPEVAAAEEIAVSLLPVAAAPTEPAPATAAEAPSDNAASAAGAAGATGAAMGAGAAAGAGAGAGAGGQAAHYQEGHAPYPPQPHHGYSDYQQQPHYPPQQGHYPPQQQPYYPPQQGHYPPTQQGHHYGVPPPQGYPQGQYPPQQGAGGNLYGHGQGAYGGHGHGAYGHPKI